jgi:tetratricopeptide (TPR) repeat protein
LAAILNDYAKVQLNLGHGEAGRVSLVEALDIYRRMADKEPAAFRPGLGKTLNNLGILQLALGERETARTSLRQALEIFWPLSQEHPETHARYFLAILRVYTAVAPETESDLWWQIWTMFKRRNEEGREPRAEAGAAGA